MILRLLATVITLALGTSAVAQSMLTDGLEWSVREHSFFSMSPGPTTRYRIGGDTIVAGSTYRVVTATPRPYADDFAATDILLREDGEGRVFAKAAQDESLLYDFTAEVGDSFAVYNPYYGSPGPNDPPCVSYVIATGDTVLADGITRSTYRFAETPTATNGSLVIEGIGSVDYGPFGVPCLLDVEQKLQCVRDAAGATLLNPSGGACFTSGPGASMLNGDLRWVFDDRGNDGVPYEYTVCRIGGDTVIAGQTFRAVECVTNSEDGPYERDGNYIREDGEGRVLVHRDGSSGLLYDFSAEVGDTLTVLTSAFGQRRYRVQETRDTTLADDVLRRVFVMSVAEPGEEQVLSSPLIEGLGYLGSGPLSAPELFGWSYLSCVLNGELLIVSEASDGQCFVSDLSEARAAAPGEAYPSPFIDHLTLDFAAVGGQRYSLFDLRGARVASGVLPQGHTHVPTAALPAGTYILVVGLADGTHVRSRVIKR